MSLSPLQRRGLEFLAELESIEAKTIFGPQEKLPKLRALLEQICKDRNHHPGTRYNLCLGLNTLSKQYRLSKDLQDRLHELRIVANKVLHGKYDATDAEVQSGVHGIRGLLSNVYQAYRKDLHLVMAPDDTETPPSDEPAQEALEEAPPPPRVKVEFELQEADLALLSAIMLQ
ncbi:MAG: DUF4145 domain-containing protein, partial [Bacteroidota bacterium]